MRVGFNFWDVHELITLKVKSKIPNQEYPISDVTRGIKVEVCDFEFDICIIKFLILSRA